MKKLLICVGAAAILSGCVNISVTDTEGQYLSVFDQAHEFRYEMTLPDGKACSTMLGLAQLQNGGANVYCSKTSKPGLSTHTYADRGDLRGVFYYKTSADCSREMDLLKKDGWKIAIGCRSF